MSMQELGNSGVLEAPATAVGETSLATWLDDGRAVPPAAGLRLITRLANALCDGHHQGIRHGAPSAEQVWLWTGAADPLETPVLRGFAPSTAAWPRREDIAADVAGLAGIARAILSPPPPQGPGRRGADSDTADWRGGRAAGALIDAAMDRREGVFLFESPLDFVVALEAAVAADSDVTATNPDPALLSMRRRRRRRRLMKVLAGTAAACLAMLAVSSSTATHQSEVGRAGTVADSSNH